MKRGINTAAVALCAVFLTACSSYHRNFSCSEYPELGCRPTEEVFEKSEGAMVDYRRTGAGEPAGKSKGKKKSDKDDRVQVAVSPTAKQLTYVSPGDPVLTKPEVMRILFFPWEDKEADLNAGGYIYVRIGEPEWLILKN